MTTTRRRQNVDACPFCACDGDCLRTDDEGRVTCDACGAEGPTHDTHDQFPSENLAPIDAWNKRHWDSSTERLLKHLKEAECKAWDALGRYKFQMFGYWAAIWVHLNRIGGFNRDNPFKLLVHAARKNDSHETTMPAAVEGAGGD